MRECLARDVDNSCFRLRLNRNHTTHITKMETNLEHMLKTSLQSTVVQRLQHLGVGIVGGEGGRRRRRKRRRRKRRRRRREEH